MLTVNRWPEKIPKKQLQASEKDLNWFYRVSKHLGTNLLTSFPSRVFLVFEMNEDEILVHVDENKCQWCFVSIFIGTREMPLNHVFVTRVIL